MSEGYMLVYRRFDHLKVIKYADSDHVAWVDIKKSTFGYLFMMARGAISWKSAKRTVVVIYIMEAEFVACFDTTVHGLWLQNFISGLRIVDSIT